MQSPTLFPRRFGLVALFFVVSLLFGACNTLTSLVINNEQEVEIGEQVADEIYDEFALLKDDDPVTQWATALVDSMVDASDDYRDHTKFGGYEVHVIYDNELVNAFAAPGGFVYIVSGLIMKANNCAEVAGVVGHELAHVTQRHSAKSIAKNAGLLGLTEIVLKEGITKDIAQGLYVFLQNTHFSRKDETEADKIGAEIMYKSGYHPQALANMFRILAQIPPGEKPGEPNRFNEFFSSHPDSNRRIAAIEAQIEKSWPTVHEDGQHVFDCVGTDGELTFAQVKERLASHDLPTQPGSGQKPHATP